MSSKNIKYLELPLEEIILVEENPRDISDEDLNKLADDIVKRYYAYCISKNINPVILKNGIDISNEDWISKK